MNQSQRVLIVDDDWLIGQLQRTLTGAGYVTEMARDGREALVIASQRRPDAVIVNLVHPSSDGVEVCRQLRRNGEEAILMLAPKGDARAAIDALNGGADDCLTKPFDTAELLARVQSLLRRRGRVTNLK